MLTIFQRRDSERVLPRDTEVKPLESLNIAIQGAMANVTDSRQADRYSGTLSTGVLQSILEYTTLPGDIVFTLNAQFGAIYHAAENCGRLVYGTESFKHFEDESQEQIEKLLSASQADTTTIAPPAKTPTIGLELSEVSEPTTAGDQGATARGVRRSISYANEATNGEFFQTLF